MSGFNLGGKTPPAVSNTEVNQTLGASIAALEAAQETGQARPDFLYSCLPIQNYMLGRFQFSNGYLGLYESDDAAEFERELAKQPVSEQNRIRKLVGEDFENAVMTSSVGRFTQGPDSTDSSLTPAGSQQA